jgi:ATP-dependent Clp protease protease subunit
MKIKYSEDDILQELLANPEEMSPYAYQYYKGLRERRIIINGTIDDTIIENAVIPLIDMDNDGSNEPIEILLSTNGGAVYYGFCLCSVIEKLKTPTIIRVMAMAASMGSFIMMAGYNNPNVKVVCDSFTIGLIHSGSDCLQGTTHAVKDTYKFTERYEKKIKDYVITHSKIDEEMYTRIERYEFYMDAETMLKYGIVDEIV